MFNGKVIRSDDIKDVIHIKVKKFAGYFNPESRSFAVDPHLTTFEDLQKILVEAFGLTGPFHLTYLCRDDAGENVFLSMLTDWDLDAAFMTSSDPYLRLKLDAEPYQDGLMTKMNDIDSSDSGSILKNHSNIMKNILQPVTNSVLFQNTQKSWMNSIGGAINKLTVSWNQNTNPEDDNDELYPVKTPLDDAEFRLFLGENGVLTNPEGLRLRVYNGGVAPALRKVIWRMLLNIFPAGLSGQERICYIKRKSDEYEQLRSKWQAQADSDRVKQISNMVWKDVLRTDRSHSFFKGPDDNPNVFALMNILTTFALTHPQISYCQGMSDLVSPILTVMNNEAQAYICFCGLMRRMKGNFSSHGKTMSKKFKHLAMLLKQHDPEFFSYLKSLNADNMFFCYRWILLEMKREFSFDDAVAVLEVMWSSLPPFPPVDDLPLENYSPPSSPPLENSSHDPSTDLSLTSLNLRDQTTVSSSDLDPAQIDHDKSFAPCTAPDQQVSIVSKDETNLRESTDEPVTGDDSFLNGNVDFHNPRVEKKTNEPELVVSEVIVLPPPEELGCGHPFLLFVCLSVLLQERDRILSDKMEYDVMVMHFDKMVRKRSPKKVLSLAIKLFAEYLRSDMFSTSSTT